MDTNILISALMFSGLSGTFLDLAEADAMIGELRCKAFLSGVCRRPTADVGSLAGILGRLGDLSLELADRQIEVDVNSLIVLPNGREVKGTDALVVVRG